jgi:hypothetical protein
MKKKSDVLEKLNINTDHKWLGEMQPLVDSVKELVPQDKQVVVEVINGTVWLTMKDKDKS